jgi:hypothetical protein
MGVAEGKDWVGSTDDKVYGAMFAITSGVMAIVALSLFGESLALSHKNPRTGEFWPRRKSFSGYQRKSI